MDRVSNYMTGQLRIYEAYHAQKGVKEKNITSEELQKDQQADSVQFSKEGLE